MNPSSPVSLRALVTAARGLPRRARLATRRYATHALLLWESAPALAVACAALCCVIATLSAGAMVASGEFVGALPRGLAGTDHAARVWFWLAVTLVLLALGPLLEALLGALAPAVTGRYVATTYRSLMEVALHPPGLAEFDDPTFTTRLDDLRRAVGDWGFLGGADFTWRVLATRLTGVAAFAVVASWSVQAALFVTFAYAVQSRTFSVWLKSIIGTLLGSADGVRREAAYVRSLLVSPQVAKEVRVFGLSEFLSERYHTLWSQAMKPTWSLRRASAGALGGSLAVSTIANGVAVALLARDAFTGSLPAATLATQLQALLALKAFGPLGDTQTTLSRATETARAVAEFRADVGLPAVRRSLGAQETVRRQFDGPPAVEFADVTFTYPGAARPRVEQLSLTIPAGQAIAIVGTNGIGKSTLVKLLCGLYQPDRGSVRVGGRDPRCDPAARARVAVLFQDFLRLPLPLRDNVAAAAPALAESDLDRLLSDAGADELLRKLPQAADTVLSARHGGVDLSGGEWQRVALARALAARRAGADVLVLDEPSAALDVRAEANLFNRFLQLRGGATTILISHRLSTVRRCDRIVVLGPRDDGRVGVVEDGTHTDLLREGGAYARMFNLQASRFGHLGGSTDGVAR